MDEVGGADGVIMSVLRAGFRAAADAAVAAAVSGAGGTFFPVGNGRRWSHRCSVRVVPGMALSGMGLLPGGGVRSGDLVPREGSTVVRVSVPGGGSSSVFEDVAEDPGQLVRFLDAWMVETGPRAVLDEVRGSLLELADAGVPWGALLGLVRDSPAVDVISS